MVWEKGTKIQVQIEDMSDTGEGIGKTDGFTWFVKDAVIGDLVEAKVMKTKKSYGFARLEQVLKPSPHRVIPPCPVAKSCGGCQLQAMDYEEQLRFKEKKVFNNLLRIGGIDCKARFEPIIKMDNPWHYRNKAQFPVGRDKDGKIVTGFYAGRTHTIIECEDCLIGVSENARILDCIRTYMEEYEILPYDEHTNTGMVRHILIRKGFQTGQIMVCLVINGPAEKLRESKVLVERLTALFHKTDLKNKSELTTVVCSINQEKTNVIMGKKLVNLYGPGVITDWIGPVQYRISPLSFYQVNPIQTKHLYETALEYAKLTGTETVWDLYCGIGTITLFLARKAKKVCGVEVIPQAIEDACANAKLNGIENVEFFTGKAEEVLPKEYEKNPVPVDVIVVDPPRKGCDARCLETIIAMEPKRIVYISCDSATLARDLKVLGENGYEVVQGRMVDMFPWSVHIESIVLLSKLHTKQNIEVEVEMSELDLTAAESKATYAEIKQYVLDRYGLKVSSLNIAQIKAKCGIIERENYNTAKNENVKQPNCTEEKENAIKNAFKYFQMI